MKVYLISLSFLFCTSLVFGLPRSSYVSAGANSQPVNGVLHVAMSGVDNSTCGSENEPCQTIQYAIDKAIPGDTIKLAAGVYSDTHRYATATYLSIQVAYLDKGLTLQGGYTVTNWTRPDPLSNVSIIDSQG